MSEHPVEHAEPAGHAAPGHPPQPEKKPIPEVHPLGHFDFFRYIGPGTKSNGRVVPTSPHDNTGVALIDGRHPEYHLRDPRFSQPINRAHLIGAVWAERVFNRKDLRQRVEAQISDLKVHGWHSSIDPFLHAAYQANAIRGQLPAESIWHEVLDLLPRDLFPDEHHGSASHSPAGGVSHGTGGSGNEGTPRTTRRRRQVPLNVQVNPQFNPHFENNPHFDNNPHNEANPQNRNVQYLPAQSGAGDGPSRGPNGSGPSNSGGRGVKAKNIKVKGDGNIIVIGGRNSGDTRVRNGRRARNLDPSAAPRPPLFGPNAQRDLTPEQLEQLLGYRISKRGVPLAEDRPPLDADAMRERVRQAGAQNPIGMQGPIRPGRRQNPVLVFPSRLALPGVRPPARINGAIPTTPSRTLPQLALPGPSHTLSAPEASAIGAPAPLAALETPDVRMLRQLSEILLHPEFAGRRQNSEHGARQYESRHTLGQEMDRYAEFDHVLDARTNYARDLHPEKNYRALVGRVLSMEPNDSQRQHFTSAMLRGVLQHYANLHVGPEDAHYLRPEFDRMVRQWRPHDLVGLIHANPSGLVQLLNQRRLEARG